MNTQTANKITQIKAAFFANFYVIGDTKDEILDELDMAIYQQPSIRDSVCHELLLDWGSKFLDAAGIR